MARSCSEADPASPGLASRRLPALNLWTAGPSFSFPLSPGFGGAPQGAGLEKEEGAAGWNLPFPATRDGVCPLGTSALEKQARAQATLHGHWTVRRLPLPRVVQPHPRGGQDTGREVSHTVPGPLALLHPGSADSFLCVQLGAGRYSGSADARGGSPRSLPSSQPQQHLGRCD